LGKDREGECAMRRVSMIAAGFAVPLLAQSKTLAQQPGPRPAPPEAEKMPSMTLRTRIALTGVYGRMDHCGWDSAEMARQDIG
jgi:hypothetical protein